jgi:hypothetical protein
MYLTGGTILFDILFGKQVKELALSAITRALYAKVW